MEGGGGEEKVKEDKKKAGRKGGERRWRGEEGRMREESIHELGNMAHLLEGRKGRSALVSSEMWHIANEDSLARGEEEGGGRSRLVSLEMRHVTNEDSLTGGRKEGGVGR